MSKSKDYTLNWVERCAVATLKMGPMPKHIALILDGNRRFARMNNLDKVSDGHKHGKGKFEDLINMSLALDVEEITAYVFSLENFKRPQKEVEVIMKLLFDSLSLNTEADARKKGICLEFIGDLTKVPTKELDVLMKRTMILSKDNKKLKINIAFIYTGRNEIVQGCNHVLNGLFTGQIETSEVTPQLLEETFTLSPSNPVDILIRTSGEKRLSDFLLWGCTEAYFEFIGETWPEMTFWGFAAIIFRYQNHIMYRKNKIKNKVQGKEEIKGNAESDQRAKEFISTLRKNRWNEMAKKM